MQIIVLAVFLSVVQASVPIPGQAADSSSNTGAKTQSLAQQKKEPPKPPATVINPDQPKPPATLINQDQPKPSVTNGSDRGSQNIENSVSISKLPTVTVAPAGRDWVDIFNIVFSFFLVTTAIFQVCLLVKTFAMTRKQTTISQNQQVLMAQAGEQTERILTQMKDTSQRQLRAYVGVSKAKVELKDPRFPIGKVEIRNFGETPAYKVRHILGIAANPYPATDIFPDPPQRNGSVFTLSPGVKYTNAAVLGKQVPEGIAVGSKIFTIFVFGIIVYEDAFGVERHTKYRFVFGGPDGGQVTLDRNGIPGGVMWPDTHGNESD